MNGHRALLLFISATTLLAGCDDGTATPSAPVAVATERVHPGLSFDRPVAMYPVPGEPGRRFVLEKGGRVLSFGADSAEADVVLDISDRVDAGPNEAGLLGLAFHPDFTENGVLFLSYTRRGDPLVSYVSRFTMTGKDAVDPASEKPLLTLEQPYGNHNGGQIGFGPDGYLYIGFGDGGAGGDPHGNGQNTQTLLGAMLRIDVTNAGAGDYAIPPDNPFADGSGGRKELYAWGLRNPWRWSFDADSGRLWVGDVGQNLWEEIDIVEKGGNYGWNIREGAHCYEADECRTEGLADPVAEYSHDTGGCSVTGGYVYRGVAIPELQGRYVFGDYCSGRLWVLTEGDGGKWRRETLLESGLSISSFAVDEEQELYLLDYRSGGVYRLVGKNGASD